MRTANALGVCLLLFALCRTVAADDLAAALVTRAGSDALGYLRIENPKTFLEKLDAVTAKFGSRVSDELPLIAQRFLKNPLLAGIEMDHPWTFIFLNPRRHTNDLAVVVGVNDAAVFCDSFGKGGISNVKADPATAGAAVRHFSETEDAYDHLAYIAALRAGKKVEPIQFKKPVTKQYYVTARNGHGVIVGSRALIEQLAPATAKLGHDRVHGDIAVAVRVPNVLPLYEKEIRQRKESILETLQTVARVSFAAAATPVSRPGKLPGAGFDVALNFAKQVAWLEAAAELDGGRLRLRLAAAPLSGTAFSRALAGQQPLDLDEPLLAVLPANVAVLNAVRFVRTPEWTNLVAGMMQPIVTATAAGDGARDAFRALTESWGDGFARAVLAPATNQPSFKPKNETGSPGKNASAPVSASGFNVVEVLRVTDAAQARQALRKAVEVGLPLGGAGLLSEPARRLKYEPGVARHAGVEIDRITLGPSAPEKAAAEPAPSENGAATHFIQQAAFVGTFGLIAQGPGSTTNIRRLIAAARKPPAAGRPPALKAAAESFPKKHNGIFFMSLADYVGLIRGGSSAAEDVQLRRLQTQLDEAGATHAGWLMLQPRAASVELVSPLDKLLDIMLKTAAPAAR
ncbi:MAG: hypothetical protein HZC54_04920 [Verrucomicrobia bacterium]|nr:hypothetical protein [Verrucomicrobiota bacterium]